MPQPVNNPTAAIAQLIEQFEGNAACYALNLTTGATLGYQPDQVLPTASTIKLLILAEFYRQVDVGQVDPAQSLAIHPDDQRGGSGILRDLDPAISLTARDHATLMTALSDNTSTAVLVRLLGREQILASGKMWGMTQTTASFTGSERTYGASTPRDLVTLLTLIARDELASPTACQAIRGTLVRQQYHDQLARYLPYNPYSRNGADHEGPLIVRSKSGFSNGVAGGIRADAGLIEGGDGTHYVICTMNEGSNDRLFGPEHPGAILNGKISRIVFDTWQPPSAAVTTA